MSANIAVMASGRGSNLQVLLDSISSGNCPACVKLVISDKENAPALDIANREGVEKSLFVNPKSYCNREEFDMACANFIEESQCEWIILAGYMRILSSKFVQRFHGKILNIHPSLLPSFIGATAIQDALTYGVKVSGCTVHLVDDVLDGGPILAQAVVPVYDDDCVESLHARIQIEEHRLYPEVVTRILKQGFSLCGRRVVWHP
ncbi:MAG: phosphoribosylglycinamide formyltransferase [Zetaproteobacteria bacterium]|nr:phosphoribosylglycinamide formyltransferase [Zetaproteobacteria bacterium]